MKASTRMLAELATNESLTNEQTVGLLSLSDAIDELESAHRRDRSATADELREKLAAFVRSFLEPGRVTQL